MNVRYDDVKDDPITLRAWTGMDRVEIERILSNFELAWEEHRRTHHRPLPARKRALGAGRKSQVAATIDKLFFILVYFKTYPLQEVMATLFGMSQRQVNEWIHRLTAVLQATLATDLYLPARDAATLEAVLAACENYTFAIDGTERPIQRSSDDVIQQQPYSGKKNAHDEECGRHRPWRTEGAVPERDRTGVQTRQNGGGTDGFSLSTHE